MKKLFSILLFLLLIGFAIALMNCGSDTHPALPNQFAYMTDAPAGSAGAYQPVIGTITGNTFTSKPVKDPGTGEAITADFHSLVLSPDGKKGVADINGDIVVGVIDGSKAIDITSDPQYDAFPSFTSDSSKVIFLSSRGTASGWDTMMANADGTGTLTNLTADSPICHHEPSMSPDGTKITFAGHGHTADTDFYDVYVMDANGKNPVNLTNGDNYDIESGFPSFSTDSKKIIYTRMDDTGSTEVLNIYIMNADGTNKTPLTTSGTAAMARFLRDGTITYMEYKNGNWEIYRMNSDGTNSTRLTNNTVYDGFTSDWSWWGSASARQGMAQRHQHH